MGDGELSRTAPTSSTCRASPAPRPAIDRNKGLHNVLDAHQDKYKFVAEQTANFARDQGLSVTESLLAGMSTPPDVIVAANDDMALGAIEAVKARGLADKVKIIGFDALPEALAAVRDGGARRHGRAVPGRPEPQGHADHGRAAEGARRRPRATSCC